MTEQPITLDFEALTRLDLKPTEILAVTFGQAATPDQCVEAQKMLADWLDTHGMPVAGVIVLAPGSKIDRSGVNPLRRIVADVGRFLDGRPFLLLVIGMLSYYQVHDDNWPWWLPIILFLAASGTGAFLGWRKARKRSKH